MVRFKNRYIAVQVNHEKGKDAFHLNEGTLVLAIRDALRYYHGDYGASAIISFKAKYLNKVTRVAIIRAFHGPHLLLTSCLPLIRTMGAEKVNLRIIYVGATLKHCYKAILRFQTCRLSRIIDKVDDPALKEELRNEVFSLRDFREMDE